MERVWRKDEKCKNHSQKFFFGILKNTRQKKTPTLVNIKDKKGNAIEEERKIMERM